MTAESILEFMNALPDRYNPGPAGGPAAAVQFHFTGAHASDWTLELDGTDCRTKPGVLTDPSVTVTIDSGDFIRLLEGELEPMAAFMRGKLKVKGDVSLAMKLTKMFQ
ncbi:MAG TPA: SCP2 sterol-binding domain-containing protein [Anaerolineales bacterium]|nr:SCP2 sterol-binding domain-containing protein [Anaerolineales bacterium]